MNNLDDLMRRLASGELAEEHERVIAKTLNKDEGVTTLTPRDIDLIIAHQRLARLRWEGGEKAKSKAKSKVSLDLSSVMGVLAPKPVGSLRRR